MRNRGWLKDVCDRLSPRPFSGVSHLQRTTDVRFRRNGSTSLSKSVVGEVAGVPIPYLNRGRVVPGSLVGKGRVSERRGRTDRTYTLTKRDVWGAGTLRGQVYTIMVRRIIMTESFLDKGPHSTETQERRTEPPYYGSPDVRSTRRLPLGHCSQGVFKLE